MVARLPWAQEAVGSNPAGCMKKVPSRASRGAGLIAFVCRRRLAARISGFHPEGPGSTPGGGTDGGAIATVVVVSNTFAVHAAVAQWVEHPAFNRVVVSSSLTRRIAPGPRAARSVAQWQERPLGGRSPVRLRPLLMTVAGEDAAVARVAEPPALNRQGAGSSPARCIGRCASGAWSNGRTAVSYAAGAGSIPAAPMRRE